MKRLYEIYNIEKGQTGSPFTMCDKCYKEWIDKLPNNLLVKKIADKSLQECGECNN
jgi:hypothetical protein